MQGRPSEIRTIVALAVACCALVAPQAASGAIGSVFGGDVSCNVQGDGVRFCGSSNARCSLVTRASARSCRSPHVQQPAAPGRL